MIFYDFIYKYKGDDFKHLPGLVRRFLIYRLLRAMIKEGKRWDIERCLDNEEDFSTPFVPSEGIKQKHLVLYITNF